MKGSIKSLGEGLWRLRFDVGVHGDGRRKQRMVTFKGNKKQAQQKLRDLCNVAESDDWVEPSKLTLKVWLGQWIEAVKPNLRPATYVRYKGIIDDRIADSDLGAMPLQKIRPTHIEAYYAAMTDAMAASTLTLHHAILHRAMRKALRDKLVTANPAIDLEVKPRRGRSRDDARLHCWTAIEARRFLAAAAKAGPQPAAFYTLALDSGMRKGELCGLLWENVDLDAARTLDDAEVDDYQIIGAVWRSSGDGTGTIQINNPWIGLAVDASA